MAPEIGKVTERRNGRLHYAVNGRAACGSGRGWIIPATLRSVSAELDVARVCKRCRHHLREALVAATERWQYRRGIDAARTHRTLSRLADALRTPAQVTADEAFEAEMPARFTTDLIAA